MLIFWNGGGHDVGGGGDGRHGIPSLGGGHDVGRGVGEGGGQFDL